MTYPGPATYPGSLTYPGDGVTFSSVVLSKSPLAWYRLGEASGTTMVDSSGNGRNGVHNNTPTLGVASLIPNDTSDTAITYNGSNEYSGTVLGSWMQPTTITVVAFINPASVASSGEIASRADNTGAAGSAQSWRMVQQTQTVAVRCYVNNSATTAAAVTGNVLAASVMSMVAFTFDGSNIKIYVNGSLSATQALSGTLNAGSYNFNIGKSSNAGNIYFNGTEDEVMIFGSALTATDISDIWNAATSTVVTTTVSAPVNVGLSFAASTAGAATTVAAPVTAGLSFAASTVARSTVSAPVGVGLSFATASVRSTVAAPVSVGLAFRASGGDAILSGWDADFSQQAVIDLTGPDSLISGSLVVTRTPATAPAAITERVLVRHSHLLPALAPDADGRVHDAGTYTQTVAQIGVPHVWVNGRDVTYFRNAPTEVGEWASSLPFGDDTAVIRFPQMTPWDVAGTGDLDWLYKDAPVHIAIIDASGNVVPGTEWFGRVVSDESGNTESDIEQGWHCRGDMSQAAEFMHQPPIRMKTPVDIGTVIPQALNGVVSRRYGTLATVATGITTLKRGAYSDTVAEYVQGLLAEAWTSGARQWTVGKTSVPRRYSVQLKPDVTNPASSTFTVTSGAPGVEVSLSSDGDQRIDAIFGKGVGPKGEGWAGWVWPGLLVDNAPDYPFTSASNVISLGTTDADTDSGDGVSTWQERARVLGYKTVEVDGVYRTDDRDACKAIQRRYGILVDGIVGPQTWAATFAVGSNAGSLDGAYRAPLAVRTGCEPYLYSASGAKVGTNPAYNPDLVRREIHIDYGSGVTKAEARLSAQDQLDRSSDPGWVGTVTFTKTDPWEKSRWEITEGEVFTLKGWRGTDVLLSVVEVRKSLTSVTLTVDSKARDAMTVSSILTRDRDAKIDPARRPGNVNRRSRMERDQIVEYDSESGAGRVPKFALYEGLWSVIHIPLSEAGTLALTQLTTSSPASEFYVGMFASPITAAHLVQYVGDPSQSNAWNTNVETLEERFGYITSWGNDGEACGHFPYDGSGPVTGKFRDDGALAYDSNEGGWVWLAFYSPRSCFIRGRLYPQPIE